MIADYIRHLREVARADASSVGAKAASLGDLMGAGFPVPGGFCIPALGYRHFAACAGLEQRLGEILGQTDLSDPLQCEGAASEIRRRFLAARLPRDLRRAVEHAYLALSHRMGEEAAPVAVRCSPLGADACDLPKGCHESLLNVMGVEPLGAALKQCWASLHSSQALQHRAAREIPHESAAIALIVQRLVGAGVSGSMFTADPQSGDPLRIVIQACFGLGEGVAGGALAADRYVVDAAAIAVTERQIADKPLMVGRAEEPAQSTVVVPVPQARRHTPALSDEQAVALARVGMQIDQHFDARCEVAWAICDGEIFVLSAKPIARLPAFFPTHLSDDARAAALATAGRRRPWGSLEAIALRMSPRGRTFTWSLRRSEPVPPLARDLWRLIVSRFNRSARRGRLLGIGAARWQLALLNGYHYSHREAGDPWRPRSEMSAAVRFLLQAPVARGLAKRWRDGALPRAERAQQRLAELAPSLRASAVAEVVVGLVRSLDELLGYAYTLGPLASEVSEPAPALLAWLTGRPAPAHDLVASAEGMSARPAESLWRLSQQARRQVAIEQAFAADSADQVIFRMEAQAESRAFLDEVRRFAAEHALLDPLALADLDEAPAWMQDVGSLLMAVRQHLLGADDADREQALREHAAARLRAVEAARARLSSGLLRRLWPWRRWLFDYLLRTVQALQPLADDCRENAPMRVAAALREALRLLAEALVGEGYLESPDEIAFLSLADIETLAQASLTKEALRAAIEPRRRRLRRLACLTPPARIPPTAGAPRPQGKPAHAPLQDPSQGVRTGMSAGGFLSGAPCSPGKATGPAKYVDSPRDLPQFRRGDVLVCGRGGTAHTILFPMAAAFIQEEAGLISHCALLAREYGVPAVVGVSGLAQRVRDGQMVTVDGTSGTVSVEPEGHA